MKNVIGIIFIMLIGAVFANYCEIIPSSVSVNTGETQMFSISCYLENTTQISCPATSWSTNGGTISPGASPPGLTPTSTFTSGTTAGQINVSAIPTSYIACVSSVTLLSPPPISCTLSPQTTILSTDSEQLFTAECRDAFNNIAQCSDINWSVSEGGVMLPEVNSSTSTLTARSTIGEQTVLAYSSTFNCTSFVNVTTETPFLEMQTSQNETLFGEQVNITFQSCSFKAINFELIDPDNVSVLSLQNESDITQFFAEKIGAYGLFLNITLANDTILSAEKQVSVSAIPTTISKTRSSTKTGDEVKYNFTCIYSTDNATEINVDNATYSVSELILYNLSAGEHQFNCTGLKYGYDTASTETDTFAVAENITAIPDVITTVELVANVPTNITQMTAINTTISIEEFITPANSTQISVSQIDVESIPTMGTGFKTASTALQIESTVSFTSAVLKIYYDPVEIASLGLNESALKMYFYNETSLAWEVMDDSAVNEVDHYVYATTTHFSNWLLAEVVPVAPPAPAPTPPSSSGSSYYTPPESVIYVEDIVISIVRANETEEPNVTEPVVVETVNEMPCVTTAYQCGLWSECNELGKRTRECEITNGCYANVPETEQDCIYEQNIYSNIGSETVWINTSGGGACTEEACEIASDKSDATGNYQANIGGSLDSNIWLILASSAFILFVCGAAYFLYYNIINKKEEE